jgi:hypothetical protein
MKKFARYAVLLFLLAGCSTTKVYRPNTAAGPAKPANYPIPLYNEDMPIPRPCELIGELSIGDTEFTVSGGSMKSVMKTMMDTAHEKGADVVQITSMLKPDFDSSNYRVDANFLRYADSWETVAISESDFLNYLRLHHATLDPVEGIWSDGSPGRIGVIRNNAKPGREFIGFELDAPILSWHAGYKKMEISHAPRPGTYSITYYKDDFSLEKTTARLDHNRVFTFIGHDSDEDTDYEMTLVKFVAPRPPN